MIQPLFQPLNANGLFPIHYWAMSDNAQLYHPKNNNNVSSRSYILAPQVPHINQYGYGIPVVSLYRNEKGDLLDVSTNPKKPIPLVKSLKPAGMVY